jgi:glucoamylase
LLTGERGHYALAAGEDPLPWLETMAGLANATGLIPEQVWDGAEIPARRLVFGAPTGAAMPLVWAHAEFTKLMVSRHLGAPFDRPRSVWSRYQGRRPDVQRAFWSQMAPIGTIQAGLRLVLLLPRPALIHWGIDGWQEVQDLASVDSGLDFQVADLDTRSLKPGQRVDFTFRWQESNVWVGSDYYVEVGSD